jgi:hypothetical protein
MRDAELVVSTTGLIPDLDGRHAISNPLSDLPVESRHSARGRSEALLGGPGTDSTNGLE